MVMIEMFMLPMYGFIIQLTWAWILLAIVYLTFPSRTFQNIHFLKVTKYTFSLVGQIFTDNQTCIQHWAKYYVRKREHSPFPQEKQSIGDTSNMTTSSLLRQGCQLEVRKPQRALDVLNNTSSSPPSGCHKPWLPTEKSRLEAAMRAQQYPVSQLIPTCCHPCLLQSPPESKMPVHLFLIQYLILVCSTVIQI